MLEFKNLKLNPKITSALEKKGYTIPTPIQLQAIPHILEGKDLLGIAQTGTGKTAAFCLPIINNLVRSDHKVGHNKVRTLILTPTRELASQINDNAKLYAADLHLKSGIVLGGVNINNQIKASRQGFDILVATPGRLLDLMNQGHIKLSQIEIFVLDEADRMLDMGFINDVKKIIAKLPVQRQTLFFSATMPKEVATLAHSILQNPIKVEVTPESTTVERIEQSINFVEKANKPLLLKTIIKNSEADDLFLVFSKTKHIANRITLFLEQHSIKAAAIHGNKSQNAREKALEEFKLKKIKVLVATDIAARGIDVKGITHVINFELPNDPESYVHRIGRTGRAGKAGIAISFCDGSERESLKNIERIIKMSIPVDENHPLHGVEASAKADSALPKIERGNSGRKPSAKNGGSKNPPAGNFSQKKRFKKSKAKADEELPVSYFASTRRKNGGKGINKSAKKSPLSSAKKPAGESSKKTFGSKFKKAVKKFSGFGGSAKSKPNKRPNK